MHLLLLDDLIQVTLTASHEKREAEVKSLRFQLETEKSRYRKMQSDLQKELNVAFDENTKLTTLLDGNVPKSRFPRVAFIDCSPSYEPAPRNICSFSRSD